MPQAKCFDAPTLKDYLLGKLSDEQSDVVAAHLEACLACEATVSQLDRASDTLTNGLRLPAVAAEPQTDDELQKALDKVQSLEALANHPTSEVSKTSEVSASRSPLLRDYRLLEPLGSGGMGQVFKAVHTRLDRLVAVKLLPARRLGDEQAVARFQREMRVIGQLSHPAIVQATDAGEVDGTHFLVMEFVEGHDLNTIAKSCGPLSIADACEIARQAALGLEYAHQQGIVHRDIKPSNLMLSVVSGPLSVVSGTASNGLRTTDNGPTLKILDLGLALLSGEQAPVDELTTVGQLMGTLDYMAPEQLEDSHLVGPSADIYALAATLFRLLTGVAPFAKEDRKTPLQKLRALATQSAPPIRERRADLPEELAVIIDRALNRDPAERFASMSEFAEQLAPWCAGHDLLRLSQEASRCVIPAVGPVSNLPVIPTQESRRHPPAPSIPSTLAGQVENRLHGPRRRTLIAALLTLVGFVVLGVVIVIETNTGTLIVESVRDGVEVRVKKSGRMVEPLEVTTGSKTTRLAAGEYEIEVVADGLQIQNNKFVLKRGDTVVAKIVEVPKGQPVVANSESDAMELPVQPPPRKPVEIVDRSAKGMETFEASNLDLVGAKKIRETLQKRIDVTFEDNPLTDCLAYLQDQAGVEFFLDKEALLEEGLALDTPGHLKLNDVRLATALEFLLRPLQCAWVIDQGQVLVTTKSKEGEHLVTRSYPVGRLLPGVRQAVERMKSEAPTLPPGFGRPAGGGGFGGGTSGGGFFQVGDADTAPSSPREALRIHRQFGGAASTSKTDQQNPNLATFVPTEGSHFKSLLAESLDYQWVDTSGEGGNCELLRNVLVVRHTWRAHADIEALLRVIEAAFLKPLTEPVEIRPAGYSLEADAKLRERLAHTLEVSFTDTPLTDVAEWLGDKFGAPVLLETDKLTEEGIATDTPATLQFKSIPGDVLLSRLLDPLQLDYRIEHGLFLITTKSSNKERLVTKVYDVRDLFARGLHPNRLVSGLATTTSGPWQATDGEGGTLVVFADTLLIIRHTSKIHDEVAKSITSLRTQLSDQPEAPFAIELPTKPRDTDTSTAGTTPDSNPGGKTSTTPAKPATDNQPRYDGKTFDEWFAVLDVERSPARLADAFQALRLLHQNHQAATVAQRVLAVFRQVSPDGSFGDAKNRRQIAYDATETLTALPENIVHEAAANELNKGNTRSRKFVFGYVLTRRGNKSIGASQLIGAVLAVSRDSEASIRASALQWLAGLPSIGIGLESNHEVKKRFRQSLSDNAPEVTYWAAYGLLDSEPDTPFVVDVLKRLIGTPPTSGIAKTSPLQSDAMKLAAIMGPRAAAAAPAIAPFLLLRDSSDGQPGGFFMSSGGFNSSSLQLSIKALAALSLARMGKAAAGTLPTIEEVLKQLRDSAPTPLDSQSQAFNAFGARVAISPSGRSSTISFLELLTAAKARLKNRPAPDPASKPIEVKLEDTLLVQSQLKLLEVEQLLLEQYYGPGAERPELRELDQKRKAAEEEFNALQKLYDEQRKNAPRRPAGTSSESSAKPADPPKFKGETLGAWIDKSIANDKVEQEAILALLRGASAQDVEPLLSRNLQILKTERSLEGFKTNVEILGMIGRQHFPDRVAQACLDVLRERFEDQLRALGPEWKPDNLLVQQCQRAVDEVVFGIYQLPSDKLGSLLQRELKEGSLVGRCVALSYFRAIDIETLQPHMEPLLPLLLPFVRQQVADVPPVWKKRLRLAAWDLLGACAVNCTLSEDQQRQLIDLAEKSIANPTEASELASDLTKATVFQVLVKLSPKSERLVPTILKLESEPRTGFEKAMHSEWTASILAQIAKQDPQALEALIRLLDEDAFSEETRFPSNAKTSTVVTTPPRAYAIRRLGELGPAARDALPVLKKQLESKNKAVVVAAEKAIQQIEAAKADMKTD